MRCSISLRKKILVFPSHFFVFCCRTAPIESPEAFVVSESVLVLSLEMLESLVKSANAFLAL